MTTPAGALAEAGTPVQVALTSVVFASVAVGGLPGATTSCRLAGATTSGPPVSGTFAALDLIADLTGALYLCTVAGTPGTWVQVGSVLASPLPITQGGTGAASAPAALTALGAAALAGATFTGKIAPAVVPLTFGASVALNAALGNVFTLTLTASTATIAAPTNPVDGQEIALRVTQGGSGSNTLAFNAIFDFGAAGAPTLSTSVGKVDILRFQYSAALAKWCMLSAPLGF